MSRFTRKLFTVESDEQRSVCEYYQGFAPVGTTARRTGACREVATFCLAGM